MNDVEATGAIAYIK